MSQLKDEYDILIGKTKERIETISVGVFIAMTIWYLNLAFHY